MWRGVGVLVRRGRVRGVDLPLALIIIPHLHDELTTNNIKDFQPHHPLGFVKIAPDIGK